MRWWAVLVLCASCNQWWGLDETRLPDADVAVMECPPIGTLPTFSKVVVQRLVQDCIEVSVAGDRMVARCTPFGSFGLGEGPLDGPLAMIAGTETLKYPRMWPDGSALFALDPNAGIVQLDRASGWAITPLPFPAPDFFSHVTEPTTTTPRHVVHLQSAQFREYVESGSTWIEQGTPTLASTFGATFINNGHLSSDGLRFIAPALTPAMQPFVVYADRRAIGDPFTVMRLPIPPGYLDPVLAENCTRLYFSGIGFVLSVDQR